MTYTKRHAYEIAWTPADKAWEIHTIARRKVDTVTVAWLAAQAEARHRMQDEDATKITVVSAIDRMLSAQIDVLLAETEQAVAHSIAMSTTLRDLLVVVMGSGKP
jgi:hypothetical protein